MNSKNCQRGFSLIEALVILLVTAVLLAITVPWLTVKKQTGGGEKWLFSKNLSIHFGSRANSANVGIGTSYPKARLHVVSSKRIVDDCGTDDCTAEGQRKQAKGADMILESSTRAPILRFRIHARDVNFYLNSEVNNIGFGEGALLNNINSSGANNAIDQNSDYQKTQSNIALGLNTLSNLRDGIGNIAIGADTLRNLETGSNNVAIGSMAMRECVNNTNNNVVIASGIDGSSDSRVARTCGSNNLFVGLIGANSFNGSNNVFLDVGTTGAATGLSSNTGNVFIGQNLTKNPANRLGALAAGNGAGYLNIGDKILGKFSPNTGNFDNRTQTSERLLFDTNLNVKDDTGRGVLFYRISVVSSDVRLKTDIKPYMRSVDDLVKLKTYNFFYKFDKEKEYMKAGILAQDLINIMPEAVSLNEENRYIVDYSYINMAMVNAAKDIKKDNDALSAELYELEKQVSDPSFKICGCKKQTFFDKFLSFIRLK